MRPSGLYVRELSAVGSVIDHRSQSSKILNQLDANFEQLIRSGGVANGENIMTERNTAEIMENASEKYRAYGQVDIADRI